MKTPRSANDRFGQLSGFAWSENTGWINFDPVTCVPDPTCGVSIDPATGYFSGRAWGENIGWVSFSEGSPLLSSARTSWCQSVAPPPGPGIVVRIGKAGPDLDLSWNVHPAASWYDVVRGSLSALRASQGNFTLATQACAAQKLVTTSRRLAEPVPPAGSGFWYLLRGANCRGHGTYDSGGASQVGSRDAEIEASGADCP
jgi:hypothetical protein